MKSGRRLQVKLRRWQNFRVCEVRRAGAAREGDKMEKRVE
jgi:hypothetical protein